MAQLDRGSGLLYGLLPQSNAADSLHTLQSDEWLDHCSHQEVHCYAGSPATVVSPSRSPQANAAANVGADGAAQATETASVPLSKDISAVIEAAKQEVETVAKAYYGAKVRRQKVSTPIVGNTDLLLARST